MFPSFFVGCILPLTSYGGGPLGHVPSCWYRATRSDFPSSFFNFPGPDGCVRVRFGLGGTYLPPSPGAWVAEVLVIVPIYNASHSNARDAKVGRDGWLHALEELRRVFRE